MPRVLMTALLVGLVGLAACQSSPMEPTSATESGLLPPSGETRTLQTAPDDDGRTQLQSLTARLAEDQSPGGVSAQSTHELDRLRALIAALTGQLQSDGGGGGGAPPSDPMTVSILGTRGSNSFSPNPVSPGGRTLVWRNDDVFAHRIVADDGSFDTGNLAGGATSGIVQPPAGSIDYHCSIHPTMVGSIGSGGSSGGGNTGGGGGTPYALGGR